MIAGKSDDSTPLWLFADQLGPHVHGGEHAHRPAVLEQERHREEF